MAMKSSKIMRYIALLLAVLCIVGAFVACSGSSDGDSEKKSSDSQATKTNSGASKETPKDGFVTIDDVRFYYVNGEPQVDTIVGDESEGYFYADKSGAINSGYCNGMTIGDEDWIIIEGKAYKVETESDKCLFTAAKDIAACTTVDMTKEEKAQAAFDYIKEHYLEGVRHNPPYSYTKKDWPIVCANDLFVYGKGDCYSYGAAYAYMAKAIGYEEVYACNSGGHGWAEIDNRTYDPEWSLHSNNYTYFGIGYDEECDVPYANSIADEADFKRLKIEVHSDFTAS